MYKKKNTLASRNSNKNIQPTKICWLRSHRDSKLDRLSINNKTYQNTKLCIP